MARARISDSAGLAALAAVARLNDTGLGSAAVNAAAQGSAAVNDAVVNDAAQNDAPDRATLATAVRYTLQVLAERAKGNTVEVRVPPFAAVQCIEGPGHTRGTPPNVVEMDAPTWLSLVTGSLDWTTGVEAGRIHASGQRADLRGYVPLAGMRPEAR